MPLLSTSTKNNTSFLKSGFSRGILDEKKLQGPFYTKSKLWLLHTGNEFPVVLNERNYSSEIRKPCHVIGECYLCTPDEIAMLDRIEANGYLYQRELVHIVNMNNQEERVLSWMYKGMPEKFLGRTTLDFRNIAFLKDRETDTHFYNYLRSSQEYH
jgi:gamma-glutamylcyclotransferase (GGCT)/AIG2-like uncharacterized protein YtfP